MTIFKQFALQDKSQRRYFVDLKNLELIGKDLTNRFLVSRGRKFSGAKIGRILAAMIYRRLQFTNSTDYSRQFGLATASVGALVLPAMNNLIKGLPINGRSKLQSQIFTCELVDADRLIVEDYVYSGIFRNELSELHSFATANQIALVGLNSFEPYVTPSITSRIFNSSDHAVGVLTTLTRSLIHNEELLYTKTQVLKANEDNQSVKVDELNQVLFQMDSVIDIIDDTSLHISSAVGDVSTISSEYSTLLPIFQFVDSYAQITIIDGMDSLFSGKASLQFDDQVEYDTFVADAINRLIFDLFSDSSNTQQIITGTYRTQTTLPPSQQVSGINPPNPNTIAKEVTAPEGYVEQSTPSTLPQTSFIPSNNPTGHPSFGGIPKGSLGGRSGKGRGNRGRSFITEALPPRFTGYSLTDKLEPDLNLARLVTVITSILKQQKLI